MLVRVLSTTDPRTLRDRLGPGLPRSSAEVLAAARSRVLALAAPLADTTIALLHDAGCVVLFVGGETLVAGSRQALETARGRAGHEDRVVVDACLDTFDRLAKPPALLRLRGRTLDLRGDAQVMGIVNVTPDSFYERVDGVAAAVEKARAIAASGGAIVDVGGQSYAASNAPISAGEEIARVVPAIEAIASANLGVAISVDTWRAEVAGAALRAGADLVNDCSGLRDPDLAGVVAEHGAGLVVMHLRGELNVRDAADYVYRDVLGEIVEFLARRTEAALEAGVGADAIVVDPGLEFGKEPQTDLEILDRFGELAVLGYPVLCASSRKSFLGRLFQRPARELLIPSLATAAAAILGGAAIVRAHDVAETVDVARTLGALRPEQRQRLAVPGAASNSGPSAVV